MRQPKPCALSHFPTRLTPLEHVNMFGKSKGIPPLSPAPPILAEPASASLRTFSVDDAKHLLHNHHTSVASLRLLFTFVPERRSASLRNRCSPSPEYPLHVLKCGQHRFLIRENLLVPFCFVDADARAEGGIVEQTPLNRGTESLGRMRTKAGTHLYSTRSASYGFRRMTPSYDVPLMIPRLLPRMLIAFSSPVVFTYSVRPSTTRA